MAKISKISGFPELLPQQKMAEELLIDKIRAVYRSYGFVPIETPAVELISTLQAKGFDQKEIYSISRAAAPDAEESALALHFDLTVPFARYVAQHYNDLTFPFKRYQIQKVWRGERPQKGRFRELYQFDIDTIARDQLPLSCDAEVLSAYDKAFSVIKIARHRIHINNRKLLIGFYRQLDLSDQQIRLAIAAVDKLRKIKKDGVKSELMGLVGLTPENSDRVLAFVTSQVTYQDLAALPVQQQITEPLFQEGVEELASLIKLLSESAQRNIVIDLSMSRGFDYYTGVIFEVYFPDYPETSSFGGGGRYDNLASEFINRKLPGIGASIGFSRLVDFALEEGLLDLSQQTFAQALIAVYSEQQRPVCNQLAEQLRTLNVNCEVFFGSPKLGKQIDYAVSKGMRYVFFLDPTSGGIEVKDLQTKQQSKLEDLSAWVKDSLLNHPE